MERTLTQLPFWSSLTEQEQETLRRSAFVRHYEKGAFVHSSDTECLGMLFVLSGEIRTYLLSEEGREVTLFRLYPGELCVLSASCVISQITFDTQITAGMDTEVLIIPANVIASPAVCVKITVRWGPLWFSTSPAHGMRFARWEP